MKIIPYVLEIPTEDPEDPFIRTVTHATIGELRQCLALHEKRLSEEQELRDALKVMLDRRVAEGASDADLVCAAGSCLELTPA